MTINTGNLFGVSAIIDAIFNSVEFSNSCECGASGESGSSVDSDKYFNLFNRQKSKFKICGRWNEKFNSFLDDVVP